MNPFKYGCIVTGDFFCPRPALECELRRLIESGQNVVIQGERRMGKTSLVCEAVRKVKRLRLLYIDLLGIRSISDFCRKVTSSVSALNRKSSFLARVADLIHRLRPTLTIDTVTGSPTISIDATASSTPDSLDDVLDMVAALAREERLCVVFDEFQDILNVENANGILATMRGKIQFQPETPYILLGSVRNKMSEMFTNSRSPFYKSAALFDVDRIDDKDFASFLNRRFKTGKRSVSPQLLQKILDLADRVSGDVQELCDALWASTQDNAALTESDLTTALDLVFSREAKAYIPAVSRLTAIQMRVLKGIAEHGGARILSGAFLRAVNVPNAGSVRKSVLRLVDLDILYEFEGRYRFTNPFFAEWIRRS